MPRMNEAAGPYPGIVVTAGDLLDREFEALVRGTVDLAVRVAFSVVRRREDAEEVAQEAFARAFPRFRQLRDPARFRGWIVRATWRLAIDRWRADRRRQAREAAEAAARRAGTPSVEEMAIASDRAARLWDAIDALPEKLRLALVLSAVEGHDLADVAALLGIPEGTVKSRVFHARKALARGLSCLADDGTRR